MIKVLGFCASPRLGNSLYLLDQALEAAQAAADRLGEEIQIDRATVRGKKLAGCVMCQSCMKDGVCIIKDDFTPMQEQWLAADVILYSVPVYHMGMPAQMKAFIDRLGNCMFGRYKQVFGPDMVTTPKPLKVVGCIAQGIHTVSGQESTIIQVVNHALINGCIPVTGDMWESYIGAGGWTLNEEGRDALKKLYDQGQEDARVAVESSRSLATRAFEIALLIRNGALNSPEVLNQPTYVALAERIGKGQAAV